MPAVSALLASTRPSGCRVDGVVAARRVGMSRDGLYKCDPVGLNVRSKCGTAMLPPMFGTTGTGPDLQVWWS